MASIPTASIVDQQGHASNSLFWTKIRERWPYLDDEAVRSLCALWEDELRKIVARMLEVSDLHLGSALHIESRPQAIFEMAKLRLWLALKPA